MPVLLVASQYASMKIISPPTNKDDPAQQQTQAILKFLPLMIGWFSLNVPSGLTLYWFVNNILSTGQQLYLKSTTKVNIPEAAAAAQPAVPTTIVKPKEERVKKVTGAEMNARRSNKTVEVVEAEVVGQPSNPNPRGKKGAKFAARKAKEASKKAAALAKAAEKPAEAPEPVQASNKQE